MKFSRILLSVSIMVAGTLSLTSCGDKNRTAEATETTETSTDTDAISDPVTVLAKDATIIPTEGKGIVIDFNATWCGPCRQFHPIFEEIAERNTSKADFYSVDVDLHPALAAEFEVVSIPTVVYITSDGKVNKTVGFLTASDFASAIDTYIP